ncbi:MAG: hypothetical protein DRJ01_17405 [Bacteroidetes bacterium]|nr:MAG: hypothetical protein DRJ01_17405 [Bacteroidota bacterium]
MKRISLIPIILLISTMIFAIRNWKAYTNTTHIYDVIQTNNELKIASWGGVLIYDIENDSFGKTYTNLDGLLENDIRSLDYNSNMLLIGTKNMGISRLKNNKFKMPIFTTIGLLSNNINKIVHKDSLIFISTNKGLSVFTDDPAFHFPFLEHNYAMENGLSENDITSLKISDNNYLYCGSSVGLDYVNIDSMNTITAWHHLNSNNSPLPGNRISSISIRNNKIAIGTDNGVIVTDDICNYTQWRIYELGKKVFPVYLDNEEDLWLSYGIWDEALLTIDNDENVGNIAVKMISNDNSESSWSTDSTLTTTLIMGFLEVNGQICAYSWGNGLFFFSGEEWQNKKPNCIISNAIISIAIDNDKVVWVSDGYFGLETSIKGTRGVSCFDGEQWEILTAENSPLSSDNIFSIEVDSKNRIWFGAWQSDAEVTGWMDGISIYDKKTNNWDHFTKDNGLYTNLISQIIMDDYGRMWVSTYDGGVNIIDKNDSLLYKFKLYNDNEQKVLLTFIGENQIFFGSCYKGLQYWNDSIDNGFPITDMSENWIKPQSVDITSGTIYAVTSHETFFGEEIWVAAAKGLFMFDGQYWFKYGTIHKKQVLISNNTWVPQEIDEYPYNTPEYWYVEGQERLYGSIPTYPTALFVDPFNSIWIGTESNGITLYNPDNDKYTNLTMNNSPLLSNKITSFAYEPHSGTLYIGTNDGLNSVEIGIPENANTQTKLNNTKVYPNPFYPDNGDILTIENVSSKTMPRGNSYCNIYDLSGMLVTKLKKDQFQQFSWNGKNNAEKNCATGIYFYVISALNGQTSTGSFVLIR